MQRFKKIIYVITVTSFMFSACSPKGNKEESSSKLEQKQTASFTYQEVEGIGKDSVYNRRDPSDVIKVGGKYYVYYTRMDSPVRSGYWGTIWYATSEDEGYTWQEQGMALGLGKKGTFDSHSVFTPNILAYGGKYYMYYTAVKPTPGTPDGKFEGNSTNDFTAIGVAVADSPDGPFVRLPNNPVIGHSQVVSDFDSYRVDDASMLVRDGKIWLYYKGRCIEHGKKGPKLTEMGVAMADSPEGPFVKYGSLLDRGHEVLIWKEGEGVSCLASLSHSINHAEDGLSFAMQYDSLKNIPMAPGLYRPHLQAGNPDVDTPGWGISMTQGKGYAYLMRFEMLKN
ncbi:MAG: family 43 glycosylhydrolase [Cyclobacteriaceae bacterium]